MCGPLRALMHSLSPKSPDPHFFTIHPDLADTSGQLIGIPLQHSYHGPYCIPSSLADQSCETLGLHGLLNRLNDIMGTSFPLRKRLSGHLHACISRGDDFGMAYARLRPQWHLDFDTLDGRMAATEDRDAKERDKALDLSKNEITNAKLPPRRVWDLYSNRVVPRSWVPMELKKSADSSSHDMKSLVVVPVSHAWVAGDERSNIYTSINAFQWPVPVPLYSSLERVRIELLNLGLEYSWLDVLCLRQKGSPDKEALRVQEWKVDVPTIGAVYRVTGWDDRVVVYFNGLGRPFQIQDLTSPRHWLNRAWTVQEAGQDMIVAGQTPSFPDISQRGLSPAYHEFYERLELAKQLTGISIYTVSQAVNIMRERSAVSELDKIAGLVTLLDSERIPIYDESLSPEDAWASVIAVMSSVSRAHLLFWYPVPGDSYYSWAPSWSQLVMDKMPPAEVGIMDLGRIEYEEKAKCYGGRFIVFNNSRVLNLGSAVAQGSLGICCLGYVVVADKTGTSHQFTVLAEHDLPIDETASYVLVLSYWYGLLVVGTRDDAGHVRKICALKLSPSDHHDAIAGIGQFEEVIFA